jgi:hypothetical protein
VTPQQFGAVQSEQSDPEEIGGQLSQSLAFHPVANWTGGGFEAGTHAQCHRYGHHCQPGPRGAFEGHNDRIMAMMKRLMTSLPPCTHADPGKVDN